MHHALFVEDIRREIFSYFKLLIPLPHVERPSRRNVLALATTCRAFKEPALDILWEELPSLAPLVRCVPGASSVDTIGQICSLNRRLQQADWDIILGYTCRVRELPRLSYFCGLTADSFKELSKPPSSTVSIFPKLRYLALLSPQNATADFLRQFISPGLTQLYLHDAERFGTVAAFGEGCPNVKSFGVGMWGNSDMISRLICHWPSLHYVDCREVDLNVAAFAHLSCLRDLYDLHFKLHDDVVEWIKSCQSGASILTFATLRSLSLDSESLGSVWRFLHHLCLPVMQDLAVTPYDMPTARDLMSFLAELQATCAHDTLHNFTLHVHQPRYPFDLSDFDEDPPRYHITSDHLHPLTVFMNIQSININLRCGVALNQYDLLCLAASWPRLKRFSLYETLHQTRWSGITPGGFIQLLERCRSLRLLSVRFDPRSYTEPPRGHPWRGLRMPKDASLDLRNSPIEEESVYPLGVFFHVAPYPNFKLAAHWSDPDFGFQEDETKIPWELREVYRDRWKRVDVLARRLCEEREGLRRSLLARFSDNDVL